MFSDSVDPVMNLRVSGQIYLTIRTLISDDQ